jgi:hypothetical protein
VRANQLYEVSGATSKHQLFGLAQEFINRGMTSNVAPSWLNDDGSYSWRAARNAHFSELPLRQVDKLLSKTDKLLDKVHYSIWLEYEDERLKGEVQRLEKQRANIRSKLAAIDIYG